MDETNKGRTPYDEWLAIQLSRPSRGPRLTREERNERQRERYQRKHPRRPAGPYGRYGQAKEDRNKYLRAWHIAHREETNRKLRERYDLDPLYREKCQQQQRAYRERQRAKRQNSEAPSD